MTRKRKLLQLALAILQFKQTVPSEGLRFWPMTRASAGACLGWLSLLPGPLTFSMLTSGGGAVEADRVRAMQHRRPHNAG